MPFNVYILQSLVTGRYYVGQTANLQKRVNEHNSELAGHTRKEQPWQLIWTTVVQSGKEATALEKKIKARGAGRFLADIKCKGM